MASCAEVSVWKHVASCVLILGQLQIIFAACISLALRGDHRKGTSAALDTNTSDRDSLHTNKLDQSPYNNPDTWSLTHTATLTQIHHPLILPQSSPLIRHFSHILSHASPPASPIPSQ